MWLRQTINYLHSLRMCSIGRDRAKVIVMAQTEVKRRKYVMKSYFSGMPKREDLEIVEEVLPPLKDGGKGMAALDLGCLASVSC